MTTLYTFDVFLSHNSKDKGFIQPVAEKLREAGIKVWFDAWNIPPGGNIPKLVQEGLEASRKLILCMSDNGLGSEWVEFEYSVRRFRDPSNKDLSILPFLLTDCTIPDHLKMLRYIDFRKREESAIKLIIEACRDRSTYDEKTESDSSENKNEFFFQPKPDSKFLEKIKNELFEKLMGSGSVGITVELPTTTDMSGARFAPATLSPQAEIVTLLRTAQSDGNISKSRSHLEQALALCDSTLLASCLAAPSLRLEVLSELAGHYELASRRQALWEEGDRRRLYCAARARRH